MKEIAQSLGFGAKIVTNVLRGEAARAGADICRLLSAAHAGSALLYGGETSVATGKTRGKGGRNQELVLAAVDLVANGQIILAVSSDGWDNTEYAGALCDIMTKEEARKKHLSIKKYLAEHDSFSFFKKTGDYLLTGRLGSNVADLIVAVKN